MNRYPLSWPDGWKRTPTSRRKSGNFKVHRNKITVHQAITRILTELQRLGVMEGDSIISTGIPTRLDGLPRSDQPEPADPGVAVYWERPAEKGTKVMAIDIYDRVADNLAALAATLEAMRAIERHGGAIIMERAFTGFAALPAPGQTSRTWRHVMNFLPDEAVDMATARQRYRQMASERHPDKEFGSADAMSELNIAWEQAQEALR